jgi:thiosulfate/3-mercaptopyruvate sulfurtransferase
MKTNHFSLALGGLLMFLVAVSIAAVPVELAHPEFLVSSESLSRRLGDSNLVVLDTRKPAKYLRSHIPGAVNLNPSVLEETITLDNGQKVAYMVKSASDIRPFFQAAGINTNSRIVLYDDGGGVLAARV